MKSRIVGWVLLIVGGTGIIISAIIGSDWPMYTCIILASAGSALLVWTRCHKSRPRPKVY